MHAAPQLTGMLGAVIVVFAHDVIALFFQTSYTAALVVTYAMALRGVAGLGQLLIEPAFSAQGRTSWVMMFNLVTAAVSVMAVFCASPFGLEMLAWTQTLVVLASTVWAFALLHWRARIDVSGAIRNFAGGVALSFLYGVMLYALRHWGFPVLPLSPLAMLCLGLSCASLLGVLALVLGTQLRIFSLHAFSG